MASKIRVLDDATINKIAAGEVIENPASVIKELVENSLDAGAREVVVEILGGGRQMIRVTDDGSGMERDDALLCLERHATSKIRALDDVYNMRSMGFRGEAIPSIASISKFTLITCPAGAPEGTMVLVEGGKILKCCPAARSQGTTIEVKSLFFNVPVRRKFQKSPSYDQGEIIKMLTRLALGNASVSFQLIADQETILSTRSAPLSDRIQDVLGKEFGASLRPLEMVRENVRLSGFIGMPHMSRPNRTGQYLFINRRAVVSPMISQAVREGYGTTLPANRHPLFVLHLEMPCEWVDVNVHPQKHEVRIRQEADLKTVILDGVERALSVPRASQAVAAAPAVVIDDQKIPVWCAVDLESQPTSIKPRQRPEPEPETEPLLPLAVAVEPKKVAAAPSLHAVATAPRYILADKSMEGLVLIDQRAAHARILFERLQGKQEGTDTIQSLLLPMTLELSAVEATLLREHLDYLNQMGISIREFGTHSFVIDALPTFFEEKEVPGLIEEIVTELREGRASRRPEKEREERIALAASRAALPVDKRLSLREAQELLNQLMQCQQPLQCPRGKPTIASLTTETLASHFKESR